MYQPVTLYISLRYMPGKIAGRFGLVISWFCIGAITLSVMALITILSVMNGFERSLENNVLALMPQALLTTPKGRLSPKCIPASVSNELTGITFTNPLIIGDVILQSVSNVAAGVMLGINSTDFEPLSHYLVGAKQNDLVAGQYRVILGKDLATKMNIKHGDYLRIIVPSVSQFTPIGRIPSQRLFTVVGIFDTNSEIDSYQLLVNQQDASCLMHYQADEITGWRLWLKSPLAVNQLSAQSLPEGVVWKDWRIYKGELFKAMKMEKNMMGLLLSLIVIVSMSYIITSLGLIVIEKQAEIAILQTQGMTFHQIMLLFVIQGVGSSIIGVSLGIGLGVLIANHLNRLIPTSLLSGTTLPVSVEPKQIAIIALSVIVIALLSTLYPSWYAASIHPIKILRHA